MYISSNLIKEYIRRMSNIRKVVAKIKEAIKFNQQEFPL